MIVIADSSVLIGLSSINQRLGTIGLLIKAKQTGCISSLKETLDSLRHDAQFRMSNALYNLALKTVGEAEDK